MTQRFSAQGVRFARSGAQSVEKESTLLASLPFKALPQDWDHWPGAPAVAIWNAEGRLAYVGPYSDGVACTSDSSLIEPLLRTLVAGREASVTRQDTVSCLCELD
ncbi:MAG: DUF6436 domain-containing protein [Halopseudomonas yangmingensis]|nr:DUF6436 domain-containing protein [Halopseudomonas yangmingensis]